MANGCGIFGGNSDWIWIIIAIIIFMSLYNDNNSNCCNNNVCDCGCNNDCC